MHTYELNGSGVGMVEPIVLTAIAIKHGATNIIRVNQFGWENQPKTIRFDADTPKIAREIAHECSNLEDYPYCTFNAYGVNEYGV